MKVLALFACMSLFSSTVLADELLGEKRGGGGGSSQSGGKGSGGGSSQSGGGSGRGSGSVGSGSGRGSSQGGSSQRGGSVSSGRSSSSSSSSSRGSSVQVESRRSRSGQVDYRSQNNQDRSQSGVIRVDSVPRSRGGTIAGQARREDTPSVNSRYRTGYYQYDRGFNDDRFYYPHYSFGYHDRSVISPLYCYSNLPGYLNRNRVRYDVVGIRLGPLQIWNYQASNSYNRSGYGSNHYNRNSYDYYVNAAVNDLASVFQRRDLRALDQIMPTQKWVYLNGSWGEGYSVSSDDAYDMVRDLVTSTNTRGFWIKNVEVGGDVARVRTEHQYFDAWNQPNTVYLEFIFQQERSGRFYVREMSADLDRRG